MVFRNELRPDGFCCDRKLGTFDSNPVVDEAQPEGMKHVVRMQPPPPREPPRLSSKPPKKPRPSELMHAQSSNPTLALMSTLSRTMSSFGNRELSNRGAPRRDHAVQVPSSHSG